MSWSVFILNETKVWNFIQTGMYRVLFTSQELACNWLPSTNPLELGISFGSDSLLRHLFQFLFLFYLRLKHPFLDLFTFSLALTSLMSLPMSADLPTTPGQTGIGLAPEIHSRCYPSGTCWVINSTIQFMLIFCRAAEPSEVSSQIVMRNWTSDVEICQKEE